MIQIIRCSRIKCLSIQCPRQDSSKLSSDQSLIWTEDRHGNSTCIYSHDTKLTYYLSIKFHFSGFISHVSEVAYSSCIWCLTKYFYSIVRHHLCEFFSENSSIEISILDCCLSRDSISTSELICLSIF